MEEDIFQVLALVPGLSRAHARRLADRFPSLEALSRAPLEALVQVEGITPEIAQRVKAALQGRGGEVPTPAGLFLCPSCGSFVSDASDRCPHCGAIFEGEEGAKETPLPKPELPERPLPPPIRPPERPVPETPKIPLEPIPDEVREALRGIGIDAERARGITARSRWESDKNELFVCSNCGGFVPAERKDCPTCGSILEDEAQPVSEAEVRALRMADGLPAICAHCGAFNPPGAEVCGTCESTLVEKPPPSTLGPTPGLPPLPKGLMPEGTLPVPPAKETPAELETPKGFLPADRPARPTPRAEPVPPDQTLESFFSPRPRAAPEVARPTEVAPEPPVAAPTTLPVAETPVDKKVETPVEKTAEPTPVPPAETPEIAKPEDLVSARTRRRQLRKKDRGVTRDFARRFERVAETRELDPRQKLEEELDHYERLLQSDPDLERAWHRKAAILAELGRKEEAIEAFDRLTQLAPEREEAYRLEALNLTRTVADVSPIPPPWEAPQTVARDTAPILQALNHYDRLLARDPSLRVAWETRAELLRQLGRDEEAAASEEQAAEAESRTQSLAAEGLLGLQTRLLVRAARQRGHVNGLVNGAGLTNGMADGFINGIGKVNGLINGLGSQVDDMGQGQINGLAAAVVSRGLTNGLVNGDGFVNGRRGRYVPEGKSSTAWVRPTVGMAMGVVILVLLPLLLSYLANPSTPPGIAIDGSFNDWSGTRSFRDVGGDVAYAPADLVSFRLHRFDTTLSAYVETNGTLFAGRPPDGVDAVLLFVDADADPTTGYAIGAIGADALLEVWGWNDTLQGNALASWRGTDRDDFGGFTPAGDVRAAVRDRVLEMQAFIPGLSAGPRALLVLSDNIAEADASAAASPQRAALVAAPEWAAPDVITADGEVLRLDLDAPGGPVDLSALVFRQTGSVADGEVLLTLQADDGDGVWTPADPVVDFQSPAAGRVRFAVGETVETTRTYFVSAQLVAPTPGRTLGLRLDAVEADAVLTLLPSPGMSYVIAAPAVTVDGAFGDWFPARLGTDPIGDVLVRGSGGLRTAIDLRTYGLDATPAQVAITLGVRGRILGGVDLPGTFERPAYLVVEDHDRDSVPDGLDPSPDDFNNDNVTDALSGGDVDGDGIVDLDRGGMDLWLNTTLPAWFPAPYANRTVTLFLGDIAATPLVGADTAVAYIDADGDPATGLPVSTAAGPVGADFAIEVRGRAQRVIDSGLFAYAPGPDNPWRRIGDVTVGMDAHRLEAAFPATLANLSAAPRVAFRMRDAGFSVDTSDGVATRGTAPPPSPTNPGGTDVVINEVVPSASQEWFEIANPTNAARNLNTCVLERRQGNNWNLVYTFTQTVGAWGSGSEYLAVDLPKNSLPNGATLIRLRCGANEIDRTTYPGTNAAESWARFKDPTTGKPMDSDNDAADFYTDTTPTKGGPNTRHRPTIGVAKTVNKTATGPGDTLVYTIYYNNTDTGRANTVWINDTLPANTLFVSSSVPPSSFTGQVYAWVFTNVGPNSNNQFTITVRVDQPPNNALLVNTATLQYVDQLNRGRPGSQAWANATSVRPVIAVAKIANVPQQVPGGFIVYTVFYNNTGGVAANNVWINDTLPSQVTFVSSSVAPSSSSGQTYRWSFAAVGVGLHSFTITVQVNANATWGDAVNWAFLNYTSQFGYVLNGSQAKATVYIGEYDLVFVAVILPGLALLLRRWGKRSRREAKAL